MKTLLIGLLTAVCTLVLSKMTRFDFLDLNSDQFNFSWDDIIDDLWP